MFEKYRFYILQHSTKKRLELKNKYRPDYVSYQEYGTTNWWQLILYVNDIPSIEEFDREEILVPDSEVISRLNTVSSEQQFITDLNQDSLNNSRQPILYNLRASANKGKTIEELLTTVTHSPIQNNNSLKESFKREQFVLDIPTLRLRYITLQNEAIENTIILAVKGKPNYIYGKHYKLITSSDGKSNKITWDPNIVTGSGLVFRLKEKDIIQVNYVAK